MSLFLHRAPAMTLGPAVLRTSARVTLAGVLVSAAVPGCGGSGTRQFVRTRDRLLAITHVRVIDGTGAPAKANQTVVVQDGAIRAVGDAAAVRIPAGAHEIDGRGQTLIPGLVGMHEHLFYQMQPSATEAMAFTAQSSFAKLYLAAGVTSIRTAGTVDFDGDLRIKESIDAGSEPGPKVHVTGPYLNAMSSAPDPERIAREVSAQADRGATSFKAYTTLRASELRAAISTAHARGLRITGHLCAVGFRDAAAMGIDNLEHGLAVDTELFGAKQPDACPDAGAVASDLGGIDVRTDAGVQQIVTDLVRHGVAVTSTLAVFETLTGRSSAFDPRMPGVLATRLRDQYETARGVWADENSPRARMWSAVLSREMEFERKFVAAGGRLLAGVDPTGWGGIVAGFGDQRELELLVQAGLSPEVAIRVATLNGADFLYEGDRVGSIAPGMQADLVLVRGNPSAAISDVRNVELVFKDGVAYDPAPLIAAAQGTVGQRDLRQVFRWPYNVMLTVLVLLLLTRVLTHQTRRSRVPQPAVAA